MTEPELVPTSQRSFVERVTGALMLDASAYAEVEHDESAMGQAIAVVVAGSLAAGIGAANEGGLIAGVLGSLIGWAVSAGFIYLIGVVWMEHTSDFPELLRCIGFASAPSLLNVAGIIPGVGWIVGMIAFFWGLAAYVVAVREALDVETGKAILICVLGAIAGMVVAVGIGLLIGGAILGSNG